MTYVNAVKAKSVSIQLLNSDLHRKGAIVFNNSNKNMYIKIGDDASYENFSLILLARSYWEIPTGCTDAVYAIWSSECTGSAQVSDMK